MACQSDKGRDPPRMVEMLRSVLFSLFFFRLFSAARGQTAGPILTSYTSKGVLLGELHS